MNKLVLFGKDQQPGLMNSNFIAFDGIFYKEIPIKGANDIVHLAMVIDLQRIRDLGMTPAEIFDNALQIIESNPSRNLQSALIEVKTRITAFLTKESLDNAISFSLVAIENAFMHTISMGDRTKMFLVKKGKTEEVLPRVESQVSDMADPARGYTKHDLLKGDKVILCTDGLFTMLHGKDELNVIDRYDMPTFSAKHLNSLAKGRNVEDCVTTGVINYGTKRAIKNVTYYIFGGIAILLIAMFFILRKPVTPLPEDLGVAIPISGEIFVIDDNTNTQIKLDDFEAINPSSYLVTGDTESSLLRLKTRNLATNTTENITGVSIYASSSSEFSMTSINYAEMVEGEPSPENLLDQTTIELMDGSLLFLNESSARTYIFQFSTEEQKYATLFSLLPSSNTGVLAAKRDGNQVVLYCFSGDCSVTANEEIKTVPSMSKVSIDLSEELPKDLNYEQISDEDWIEWSGISEDAIDPLK